MTQDKAQSLEDAIRTLTRPVLGQFPRPWMTDIAEPSEAEVFVVGANQPTAYPPDKVGSHQRFLNALFNRDGETCRTLYREIRGGSSGTRSHSDDFVKMLQAAGVKKIVETNAVCFSTPKADDLKRFENREGLEKGIRIFSEIFRIIKPRVMVVHGAGTVEFLRRHHQIRLPKPPKEGDQFPHSIIAATQVFVVRSLALPEVNKWDSWRTEYLHEIAKRVSSQLDDF